MCARRISHPKQRALRHGFRRGLCDLPGVDDHLDSAIPGSAQPDPPSARQEGSREVPVADERIGSERRETQRRRLLWNAASILLTTDEPDAMLQELYEAIRLPLRIDFLVCYTLDDASRGLQLLSCTGLPDESSRAVGYVDVLEADQMAEPSQAAIYALVNRVNALLGDLGAQSASSYPLVVGARPVGVIGFARRSRDGFDPGEVDAMEVLSHQVTVALQCLGVITSLREQDRNKDEFLATVAHELRTPLSAMRNGLQLLRLASDDPAIMLKARSILDRQIHQMIRLVDDLLDVSRINSNRLELRKEWVELATVIKNAVETSRPVIEQAQHELSVVLPANPVLLDADPGRLAQALSNLLNNAAKYTEHGGTIALSAEQQGDRVVIRVRDTGMGIPRETLPHIFRMFVQARRSVERSQGGLGIGLPLVKRLVEMHGGSVSAESEGPGKGSEFVVQLPVLVLPKET